MAKQTKETSQEVIPAGAAAGPGTAVATMTEEERQALVAFGDAPGGLEDIGRDDIAIPFLAIVQALSPQLEPGNAKYMEAAKIGNVLNTATGELMAGAIVVPVDYKRSFCEWVPRNKGGGFRGEHGMEMEQEFNDRIDRATGIATLENGNHLVDTRTFFVYAGSSIETLAPTVISMSRTQTKKAKLFVNMIQNYIPVGAPPKMYPAWAAQYRFGSILEKNEKGSWYGWNIGRIGMNTNQALIKACEAFKKQIRGGTIIINREEEAPMADSAEAGQM